MSQAHARRQEEATTEGTKETAPETSPVDEVRQADGNEGSNPELPEAEESLAEPERAEESRTEAEDDEPAASSPVDVEPLASLLLAKPEAGVEADKPGTESSQSLHGYHEWHLRRLQRKLRVVTWSFAAFALATIAYLGATSETLNPFAAGESQTSGRVNEDLQRLETELGAVEAARAGEQEVIDSISASLDRIQASLARVDRRLSALARCTNRSISGMDKDLRALVQRKISPEAFLRTPGPIRCEVGKATGSGPP